MEKKEAEEKEAKEEKETKKEKVDSFHERLVSAHVKKSDVLLDKAIMECEVSQKLCKHLLNEKKKLVKALKEILDLHRKAGEGNIVTRHIINKVLQKVGEL